MFEGRWPEVLRPILERKKERKKERKFPRAPSVRWLWREKSTGAVLDFLGSTRVGCISARRTVPEEAVRVALSAGDEGEEGGPGPPVMM